MPLKYCDYQTLCLLNQLKWFWKKHGKKGLQMYQISEEKRNLCIQEGAGAKN